MNIKKKTKLRLSKLKYKRIPMYLKSLVEGKYATSQIMIPDDYLVKQGVVKMPQEGRIKINTFNIQLELENVETWVHYYDHSFKMESIYV